MKKYSFQQIAVIMMFLFPLLLSCNKLRDIIHPGDSSIPPGFKLKEMIFWDPVNGNRHYLFYYNKYNGLDSLRRMDIREDGTVSLTYIYQVTYKKIGRIDSVKLYEAGELIDVSGGYEYDFFGRITKYNYQGFTGGASPIIPVFYEYNDENATVIKGLLWPNSIPDTTFYNLQQNVTNWNSSTWKYNYTYDQQPNPLFYVKQLGQIALEDGSFYEYGRSKHNITTRTSRGLPQGTILTTFENIYDNKNRLIEQRLIAPSYNNQTFKFKYY
jgi:hypothetical protein